MPEDVKATRIRGKSNNKKVNLYRAAVDEPQVISFDSNQRSRQQYCTNLVTLAPQRLYQDKDLNIAAASPDSATGSNMFTFMCARYMNTINSLHCYDFVLPGVHYPQVTVTKDSITGVAFDCQICLPPSPPTATPSMAPFHNDDDGNDDDDSVTVSYSLPVCEYAAPTPTPTVAIPLAPIGSRNAWNANIVQILRFPRNFLSGYTLKQFLLSNSQNAFIATVAYLARVHAGRVVIIRVRQQPSAVAASALSYFPIFQRLLTGAAAEDVLLVDYKILLDTTVDDTTKVVKTLTDSISNGQFDAQLAQNAVKLNVAVLSTAQSSPNISVTIEQSATSQTSSSSTGTSDLSEGAKAGISICVLLVVFLASAAAYYYYKMTRPVKVAMLLEVPSLEYYSIYKTQTLVENEDVYRYSINPYYAETSVLKGRNSIVTMKSNETVAINPTSVNAV